MGFLKPTQGKIVLFMIILALAWLSIGLNFMPSFIAPGTNAIFKGNGFFIGYKPSSIAGLGFEIVSHLILDIVYWYVLASLIVLIYNKIKK